MSSKPSITQLKSLIKTCFPSHEMFYRNAFALACHLYIEGKTAAARKFLNGLFDQLGWEGNKTYFNDLHDSMLDHASTYANEIEANAEINRLLGRVNIV